MLVGRFLEVVIPLMLVGMGLACVIRLARGAPEETEQKGWVHTDRVWKVLVQVLVVVGIYFVLTRFFR